MRKIDIVITMAGLGSRFKAAGYQVPKYMIEVQGKSLFEWSMLSLKGYEEAVEQYIFVVRKEDQSVSFIADKCDMLGIAAFSVIEIDYLTAGQAATAMLARPQWNDENGLLIYNIDTYVEAYSMGYQELRGDGFIPCFRGDGNHWSFVSLMEDGRAKEVREKERISEYCTLGAYYFRTCRLFETLYKEYYSDDSNVEKGEKYVAPLYNYLIGHGQGDVFISVVDKSCVHVLGTPEELDMFRKGL